MELFLERAAAGGAAVDPEDHERIAGLCHRLDGVALAIELAAARLPSLGLDGLEQGLSDRLELLTGGSRVNNRHRSLRAALDWSYSLLTPLDQAVLRRVSVFAAPFAVDAAIAVAAGWGPVAEGSVSGVLAALADQSLLIPIAGATGTRYRVLETIRQYGRTRLDESGEHETVRTRPGVVPTCRECA